MKTKQFTLTVLAILVLANYPANAVEQEVIEQWQRYEQAAADEVNARCPALAAAVREAKLRRPSISDKSMSEEEWNAAYDKYNIIHNPEAIREAIVIIQERLEMAKQWLFTKREGEASAELTAAAIKAGDEEGRAEIIEMQLDGRVLLWNTIAVRCMLDAEQEKEYRKYTFAYVAADEASKKFKEITSDPDKFQTLYDNWIKV